MKAIWLPLLVAAGAASTGSCNGTKVIEYPLSDTCLEWISIYSVALEDSATVVEGEIYVWPGSGITLPQDICLRGNPSGKEYGLLDVKGMDITEPVEYTDGFAVPFTFLFSPLEKGEETFDFVCGRDEIKGVDITPAKTKYTTEITGTFADREKVERVLLYPYGIDVRVNPFISIPVRDGKFSFRLKTDVPMAYELMCWDDYVTFGAFSPGLLFSDGGKVDIVFHPALEGRKNDVMKATSYLNRSYQDYQKGLPADEEQLAIRDSLEKSGLFYTKEFMDLIEKSGRGGNPAEMQMEFMDLVNSGKRVTDKGFQWESDYYGEEHYGQYADAVADYNLEYCRTSDNLSGYFVLARNYLYGWNQDSSLKSEYKELFSSVYAVRFPDHPFTEMMNAAIAAEEVKAGNPFVDFTAPDLDGKMHTLSMEIAGKIAVIDLWASWCGPCRRHSKGLVPLYEKYRDKGFTVVGVARENGSTEAMENAIEKDGYRWLNLVELNDCYAIWDKYGAGNSGGMTVLVDDSGIIEAINPSLEEVETFLEKHIGKN